MTSPLQKLISHITTKGFNHDLPKPISNIDSALEEVKEILDSLLIDKDESERYEVRIVRIRKFATELEDALAETTGWEKIGPSHLHAKVSKIVIPKFDRYSRETTKILRFLKKNPLVYQAVESERIFIYQNQVRLDRMLSGLLNLLTPEIEARWRPTDISRHIKRTLLQLERSDPGQFPKTRIEGKSLISVDAKWDDMQNIVYNILENAKRYAKQDPDDGFILVQQKIFKFSAFASRFKLPKTYELSNNKGPNAPQVTDAWVNITVTNSHCEKKSTPLNKIFDLYYSSVKDRSMETGGTGVGLAIVKLVTILNGALVTADSGYDLDWVVDQSMDIDPLTLIRERGQKNSIILIKKGSSITFALSHHFNGTNKELIFRDVELVNGQDWVGLLKSQMEDVWNYSEIEPYRRLQILHAVDKVLRSDVRFNSLQSIFRIHLMWPRSQDKRINIEKVIALEYARPQRFRV